MKHSLFHVILAAASIAIASQAAAQASYSTTGPTGESAGRLAANFAHSSLPT